MGGYQFVHTELYSRAGRDGRGTTWVFDEAARKPDSCGHVPKPERPQVIFGLDVDAVRVEHDRRATAAKITTRNGHTRGVRQDQNTLITVVASHPTNTTDTSSETRKAVSEWEMLTVGWLRDRYGEALVSVIRHNDEAHPHLHAFILPPDPELRASFLHPGHKAKTDALAISIPDEDRKSTNKRGDAAYRQAMRHWQDSYWQSVGLPCGLARLGPGRRRLTRSAWIAEQVAQSAVTAAKKSAVVVVDDAVRKAKAAKAAQIAAEKKAELIISNAERSVANAQIDASAIVLKAKAEAERLHNERGRFSGFGGRLRALWDGLRRSTIREELEKRFQNSSAERIAVLAAARDLAFDQARSERRQRQQAETIIGPLRARLEEMVIERNRLRAFVARFQKTAHSPNVNPVPRP